MTAPLIADATLAKIVRLLKSTDVGTELAWHVIERIVDGDLADALDLATAELGSMTSNDHGTYGPLIAALEEAKGCV